MSVTRVDIETFLSFNFSYPVIDVRSEGEFMHAHIPGAVSMPLFNNEERKIVGTAYKQQSKQKAIKIGLQIFGTKMVNMVETVERLFEGSNNQTDKSSSKTVVVHCWRGGMRSGGVSWLLDLYGFKVYTIVGGYKAFRRWTIQQLEKDYPIKVLGGFTGSGKTYVLQEMKKQSQVIIDLEDLAKHRGSAFGYMPGQMQPSQEMFENLLAVELSKANKKVSLKGQPMTDDGNEDQHLLSNNDERFNIWLEDESQRIGQVNIPSTFFKKMRTKPVVFLDIPFEERLQHIVAEYGNGAKEELIKATTRIQKRLGGLETKTAINYITDSNVVEGFRILLQYYDKQYLKGLHSRENLKELLNTIECESVDAIKNADHIIARQTEKTHA